MYRSRSTSSVYFDSILNSDGPSWNSVDPTTEQHRYSQPNGTGLSLTLQRPRKDATLPVTRNTLTSALTGSKMATSDGIPSGPSRRPMPKALLPKSARAPPTPSSMYGSSLGLNSPSVVRQDSSSGSLSPTVPKSPAAWTSEHRFSVLRMESTPVGGTMLSPAVHTPVDPHPAATDSGRWNSLGRRPHTAGVNPPGYSTQRPYGASVDVSGRDGWGSGRSQHPLAASWNPPVNATPVRRREPVVQDSIVPILKAALAKDNDAQDRRMQKEEESVNRQVFRRRVAGTGTLRTVSMYGSTDDIFGKSNSHLQLAPFADSTTIPRVHLKSHSEVLPPRAFEDLQRRAVRNSMSSAVSSSDVRGTRTTPGAPDVHESAWNEPRSFNEGGHAKHPSSTCQVLSYGTQPTPAEHRSSWSNSSRPTSNFAHSNGARPSPSRTPSWEDETPPPPPLSAQPIPSHPVNDYYTPAGRRHMSTVDVDDQRNSWYDPIPVQPRNIIRSPSVVFMESPRDLMKDTKRSSSMVFFGESFSPASYPLLAKVEADVLDGVVGRVEVDPTANRGHHSRTTGSKVTDNRTTVLGWKEPASSSSVNTSTSRMVNGFSRRGIQSPAEEEIVVSVQQRTCGVENLTILPSPPLAFRDEAPLPIPSLTTTTITTTTATTTSVPHLPVSHQATDSMNTEDSGLERWEKDGNDQSADEQDSTAIHRTSSTTSTTTGRRSSSALTKKRSGSWHEEEETSEGRGSLSSSPRPNNSDEHQSSAAASPADEPYLTIANNNSGRGFADENLVTSNSILRQLLAENARHSRTSRDFDESTHSYGGSERESRSLHLDHSNNIDSESSPPPPLPPSCPPPSDFDSDANGSALGIDSESNHSYSTTVQSSVTLYGGGDAGEPGERSRPTEDWQREYGRDKLRGSVVAEDASKDEGGLKGRPAVVGDASLDLSEALIRLPGSRETTQISRQRIALEATNYYGGGGERLISETGRRGGAEEKNGEDGERLVVDIAKGPVGVGFCIEGGKGSLSGDRPIAVKRVFKGGSIDGAASLLRPGDELLSIGGHSLVGLSHYEAWRFIKALPNGTFPLAIRRKKPVNQQPL